MFQPGKFVKVEPTQLHTPTVPKELLGKIGEVVAGNRDGTKTLVRFSPPTPSKWIDNTNLKGA